MIWTLTTWNPSLCSDFAYGLLHCFLKRRLILDHWDLLHLHRADLTPTFF